MTYTKLNRSWTLVKEDYHAPSEFDLHHIKCWSKIPERTDGYYYDKKCYTCNAVPPEKVLTKAKLLGVKLDR